MSYSISPSIRLAILQVIAFAAFLLAGLAFGPNVAAPPVAAQVATPATTVVQATPTTVTLTASPVQIVANGVSTTTLTAIVRDSQGNRVPNEAIFFQTDRGAIIGGTVINTNSSGVARTVLRSATTAGVARITATAPNQVQGTLDVRFAPGAAAKIALIAAPVQLVADGQARAAITATVRDINNNLVPSQTVAFRSLTRGTIAPLSVRTDALGVATATYTASTTAGTVTVRAQAGVVTKTVDIAVVAGPARTASLAATPPSLVADNSMTSTVKITVRDQFNNPVINRTVLVSGTLGTVTPRLPRTDASGVATTTFKAGRVAGAGIVTATIDSVVVTRTIALRAGSPVTLTLTVSPTAIQANGSTTTTLQVLVRDQFGNPTPQTSVTFTSTGGVFSGSRVRTTDAVGYARVVLRSSTIAGTYAVTATVTGSEISRSGSVRFLPGPATRLSVVAAPTTLGANGADEAGLTIIVSDTNNNRVPSWPISLTARLGTVTPQATATSQQGTADATFTAGTVSGLAVVTATTGLITRTVSLELMPGAPVSIHMTAIPTTVVASTASRSTISATVVDRYGNGLPNLDVTFGTIGGRLSISNTKTNAAGVARTVLIADNQAGEARVTALSGELIGRITVHFIAGSPSKVTLIAAPNELPADEVSEAEVQAQVFDINNNPVPNVLVGFNSTLGTISPDQVNTDASGIARTAFRTGGQHGDATIQAIVSGITRNTSIRLRRAAASIDLAVTSPRVLADGIKYTTVTATVRSTVAPLAGITVTFDTTLGQITPGSEIRSDSAGRAVVRVTSPTAPGTAMLTVRADQIVEKTTIEFFAGRYTVTLPIVVRYNPPLAPLVNGDFEAGPAVGWEQTSNGAPDDLIIVRSKVPAAVQTGMGGEYLLWLGGQPPKVDSAKQSVALPAGYTAQLAYRYYSLSARTTCGTDNGAVIVNGATLRTYDLCTSQQTNAWRTELLSLAAFVGQTITLDFRIAVPTGSAGSILFIDDVFLCSDDPAAPPGTRACTGQRDALETAPHAPDASLEDAAVAAEVFEIEGVAATDAATVTVSATAANVAVEQQTTVRATVRNADGTLAVGVPVNFTVTPASRGTVSPTVRSTGSNGIASTTFTARQTTGSAVVRTSALGVNSVITLQVTAGQVVSLTLTAQPPTLIANNVTTATVRIIARDVFGNRAAGRSITVAALGGAVSPTRLSTDASGVATTTFRAGTIARTATVTATTAGITQTLGLTLTSGPVDKVTATAASNQITADGAATTTVTALVQDRYNNPVPGKVVFFVTNAGSFVGGVFVATTDTAGQAIVALLASTTAQTATVTANAEGGKQGSVRVGFVAGPPNAVAVTATPTSITANGAATTTVNAVVRDQYGNVVVNTPVAFASDAGVWIGNQVVTTNNAGTATAILRAGTTAQAVTVTATTVGNIQGVADVQFVADAPGNIQLTTGLPSLVANGAATTTVKATVRDNNGNLVAAAPVVFTSTGGAVNPDTSVTDALGEASTTLTAGTVAGSATVTAAVANASLTATTTVTLNPGNPAQIDLAVIPDQIPADGESQAMVMALVRDVHGNPTPGRVLMFDAASLVSITISATTDSTGVATATVTAGGRAGLASISAITPGASQNASIQLLPAANSMTLSATPEVLIVDNGETATITALVRDGDNAPVAGVTVTFSTTLGVITPLFVLSDGNGRAQATLDPQGNIGIADVGAQANRVSSQLKVTFRPANYFIYLPLAVRSSAQAQMLNGDFEAGPGVGWAEISDASSSALILPTSDLPSPVQPGGENLFVARLTVPDAAMGHEASLTQTFVPAIEGTSVLRYRYYLAGNHAQCDLYQVTVSNAVAILATHSLCQSQEENQWLDAQIDFAGDSNQPVVISFRVLPNKDDRVEQSILYLDDVYLCDGGDAPGTDGQGCAPASE